jgi:hypothetical protein
MALEVKLKNLVIENLNTENVSKAIFGDGAENSSLDSNQNQFIISNGYFSTAGDAQNVMFLLRGESTSDSEAELFLDGVGAKFVLENNTSYFFNCQFIGRQDNGDTVIMYVNGGAKRGSTSNSVALIGSPETHIIQDEIGVGDVQFRVNTASGSLRFYAFGKVDTNIRWLAKVELTQLKY